MYRERIDVVLRRFVDQHEADKFALFGLLLHGDRMNLFYEKVDEYVRHLDEDSISALAFQIPNVLNALSCGARRHHKKHGHRGRVEKRHRTSKEAKKLSSSSESEETRPKYNWRQHLKQYSDEEGKHSDEKAVSKCHKDEEVVTKNHCRRHVKKSDRCDIGTRRHHHHEGRRGRHLRALLESLQVDGFDFRELDLIKTVLHLMFESDPNRESHVNVNCTVCGRESIIGIRFMCLVCEDFNICGECEPNNLHPENHPLVVFKSIPDPSVELRGLRQIRRMHKPLRGHW